MNRIIHTLKTILKKNKISNIGVDGYTVDYQFTVASSSLACCSLKLYDILAWRRSNVLVVISVSESGWTSYQCEAK